MESQRHYSVITINWNNCDGLRLTIESVVGQTCRDFEYIVIDGGSTDGSVDVIKEYSDRIDYWVSEPDRGIYHAMNKGVAKAKGEYCLFLNSGDCLHDNDALRRVAALNNSEDIVVGRILSKKDGSQMFMPPTRDISLYYFYSSTLPHQSTFIRTELLRLHPYDESLRIVSDWKFFVEAVIQENCSVAFINEYVSVMDVTGISTSNPERTWEEKERVMKELFPPRLIEYLKDMKQSECLTQTLTPRLHEHKAVDRALYCIGRLLLRLRRII